MPAALACAAHTPMMMEAEFAETEVCASVAKWFKDLADFVDAFEPDCIIQFSPDHFRAFHYDLMPSFCVGAGAEAVGDWHTQQGPLNVDEDFAVDILKATRDAGIDAALSYRMRVDHGFTQIWEQMFGRIDKYPCVPIFINCIATPLPTYRRARLLGEAVGRFAAASGRRILFAASGGLSHDPVVPLIKGAPPALRNRLINGADLWRDMQPAREIDVRRAAAAALKGEGPARPLNPDWDRAFLTMLREGDWERTDAMNEGEVAKIAGYGANEVMCWIAATAALGAAGAYTVTQENYVDIPGWIVGMSTFAAMSRA